MSFVYQIRIGRALLIGGLSLGLLYCGDACNVSAPVKNISRVVQGVKVDPASVNPYRIELEPVIEEYDGRKWLATDLVYDGKRFRLDNQAQTELTRERLSHDPLAREYVDELVDSLVREYAEQTRQPIFEEPSFLQKTADYVKDKIKELKK